MELNSKPSSLVGDGSSTYGDWRVMRIIDMLTVNPADAFILKHVLRQPKALDDLGHDHVAARILDLRKAKNYASWQASVIDNGGDHDDRERERCRASASTLCDAESDPFLREVYDAFTIRSGRARYARIIELLAFELDRLEGGKAPSCDECSVGPAAPEKTTSLETLIESVCLTARGDAAGADCPGRVTVFREGASPDGREQYLVHVEVVRRQK